MGRGAGHRAPDDSQTARCPILHVDMDAFFAAVEVLDNPELRGLPVIVGGTGRRGVVASCTYEARAFGVHSAMSAMEARRRCPQAVFLAGRYDRYSETSERLHGLLREFTPIVEPVGLDEAFLDVSGATRLLGSPRQVAEAVRARVTDELRLPCAVGVARTKLLAKLASRAAKPTVRPAAPGSTLGRSGGIGTGAGVYVVEPDQEDAFLLPRPVDALWGIGPATAGRLAQIGVRTVADLRRIPTPVLVRLVGPAHGAQLAALAHGEDERPVEADRAAKSIGHEETFAADLHTQADLHRHLVRMADAVGARVAESGLSGRTVTIKVRFADFSSVTRSRTVPAVGARAIAVLAEELLAKVDVAPGVRLLGVSVSNLTEAAPARQLTFESVGAPAETDPEPRTDSPPGDAGPLGADEAWQEVDEVMGAIRARFGHGAVAPARLAGGEGVDVKRRGERQWGPSR
jgi:DNA polymerase-4